MNKQTKRTIIAGIIVLAVIGGAVGYYLYNKGPVDVKNARSANIKADELYSKYLTDTATAQKNYSGKILTVTGEVAQISTNQQSQQLLLLKTGSEGGHINCTMEERADCIRTGQQLSIKGICSGMGQGDPDLGILGDVYLTRSIVSK